VDSKSDGDEKRSEARYPTNDPVKVRLAPYEQTLIAKILNISRHGLQLELNCALPNRVRVDIVTAAGAAIFGETRYCRQTGELFHVGVLIQDAIFAKFTAGEHIGDAHLSLYVAGRGLSAAEALRAEFHLEECGKCRSALAETSELARRLKGSLPAET